jgi:hypothetical protein
MSDIGPIYFNCGEYKPGQEPIKTEGVEPPNPPIVIPEPRPFITIPFPRFPEKPRVPDRPTFSQPRIPGSRPGGPTTGGGNPGGNPGGGNPGTGGPAMPGGTGRPGNPGGGNPGQPGSTFPTGDRPSTGFQERYRCNSIKFYCPEDLTLPEELRRVISIRRFCVLCTPTINPETGLYVYASDCVFITKQQCEISCIDSSILNDCVTPRPPNSDVVAETEDVVEPASSNITLIDIDREIGSGSSIVTLEPSSPGSPVVYSQLYNIFTFDEDRSTVFVENDRYLNIFSDRVAKEVEYLIRYENSNLPWIESPLFKLTNSKIKESLNPSLRAAFSKIHYPGGILVGEELFLNSLKKHIITGRLAEFDPGYFIDTASKQAGDQIIKYTSSQVREYLDRAALGLIASRGINVDTASKESIDLRQLRRQRRLNEDVLSKVLVCPIEEDPSYLKVQNTGIDVIDLSGVRNSIETGDGDGYYFYITTREGNCIGLLPESNVANTYYVPATVRFNALTLIGEDPGIIITSESTSSSNEFIQNQSNEVDLAPLYFAVNLSSIETLYNSNPLVDRTRVNYSIISDPELIQEHLNNNGFSVTRASVDFRDPIFRYAKETSSLSLEQSDITFRAFQNNKSIVGASTLARNIPFAIVLTPVAGSKFNPFDGFSNINSFSGIVSRSLRFLPSIEYTDLSKNITELHKVNLYDVSNTFKVGVIEPNDAQNITYQFDPSSTRLTEGYFYDGKYNSSATQPSSYGASYLVKDVLDFIVSSYDPEEGIWFDVIRRMPLNKFGEFLYDSNEYLFHALSNKFRGCLTLRHVLNNMDLTDIPLLPDDSKTVITLKDRTNATNY